MWVDIDLNVIRTRNLLIWSQTRYYCATKSWKESSRTVKRSVFFLSIFIFLSYNFVYLSLNCFSFTWNKKIPIKFPGPFLNFLKNYTISEAGEHWTRRDSNKQPSKTRAIRLILWGFFLPATIFCVWKVLIFSLKWGILLEKQIPRKFPDLFWNFLKTTNF